MTDYDPVKSLREEVERFKSTNQFSPLLVTNFYAQAACVLTEVEALRSKNNAQGDMINILRREVRELERFQKRLEWLHDCSHGTKDGEGYEWGVARVKWDSNGKPLSVLWTNSDHSDLDAEMQKEQI